MRPQNVRSGRFSRGIDPPLEIPCCRRHPAGCDFRHLRDPLNSLDSDLRRNGEMKFRNPLSARSVEIILQRSKTFLACDRQNRLTLLWERHNRSDISRRQHHTMRSMPPMYCRSGSGTVMEPSAFW